MESRDLPPARLVPRAVGAHLRAALVDGGAWLRELWRRVQPQALALALTAVGALAVLGITVAIAESAIVRSTAPRKPAPIYLMHAPSDGTAPAAMATLRVGAAETLETPPQ